MRRKSTWNRRSRSSLLWQRILRHHEAKGWDTQFHLIVQAFQSSAHIHQLVKATPQIIVMTHLDTYGFMMLQENITIWQIQKT